MKLFNRAWWIARLKERSTWVGLTMIATAGGVQLSPEKMEAIYTLGTTLAGFVAVIWADTDVKKEVIANVKPEALTDVNVVDSLQRGIY
jgi:hypothetical protein